MMIPSKEPSTDYEKIERVIKQAFYQIMYKPLFAEINKANKKLSNATTRVLEEALKDGRISYINNRFVGSFSANSSKELKELGAVWDRSTQSFRLSYEKVPSFIFSAIETGQKNFAAKLLSIYSILDKVDFVRKLQLASHLESALKKVEKTVPLFKSTPKLNKQLAQKWGDDVNLTVKDFSKAQVRRLKQMAKDSLLAGDKKSALAKSIKTSFNVTAKKAKFLARQETSVLVSQYKEEKYKEAGITHYKWACLKRPHDKSPDQHIPGNVRYMHGLLEGKIFAWDKPPITSLEGTRNNPGGDYNCRCYAIPVIPKNKK